ncbi:MAG TPA: hypothetical protein VL051_00075 [Burkholderiaceae bacterium]|nr:hypothetical protein [Burkholderiaceae bacterium]
MKNKPQRHQELCDGVLGCLGYSSPDGAINPRNNRCHAKSKVVAPGLLLAMKARSDHP